MKNNSTDYYNQIWTKYEGYQMSQDLAQAGYELLIKYSGKNSSNFKSNNLKTEIDSITNDDKSNYDE
jgi:hypothetical protein